MHSRLKLQPALSCCLVLLLVQRLHGYPYPTINQAHTQQNSFVQQQQHQHFDKIFLPPPALEDTIDEVQKILAQDPSLPRLTRGEIEELYEKVTREEYVKSIEAGDMGRADSMRALMLVLPYNTDNNTEENLQELYTRPPVTKVIDAYTLPQPIKFITPDPNGALRSDTASPSIGKMAATTYKPTFVFKTAQAPGPSPTTYHPAAPPVMYKMTPSSPESVLQFQPVTNIPLPYDYGIHLERAQALKPAQRFSSHYNAKQTEFLSMPTQRKPLTTTVKPVADVLESLGIVGQTHSRNRLIIDDYYPAESAPKPVISSYVPQTVSVAELQQLRSQNLAPKIRSEAYSNFKPLNIGEEIRVKPEVEGYLTRFGIVGGRRRKALKKGDGNGNASQGNEEQASAESEIATAKVPTGTNKKKKSAQSGGNSELEKLIENLQQLERLNINPKTLTTTTTTTTTARPTTKRTTTTTTTRPPTTTKATTTTRSPPVTPSLITNGAPLLIEAKKPRRRIDPNIDINYGATGNHQGDQQADQLAKLLENLQELEKLRINPENVLKTVTPPLRANKVATKPVIPLTTTTTAPLRSQTITNRFSDLQFPPSPPKSSAGNDAQQLQHVLQQLQALEQTNARTTAKPVRMRDDFAPNDLLQLRKLLTDDRQLERLYEQARAKQAPKKTTTTTTTTTTKQPVNSLNELEQLQKYLAAFERPASTTTTTSTTSTTTTTTTTPKPVVRPAADLAQRITANLQSLRPKKPSVDSEQLQALINRVQELERQSNRATSTNSPMPFLGFTSRNVNAPPKASANALSVPTNDFAHLQQLYQQVQEAEQASYGQVEISTTATASKGARRAQNFAQRIIDITNDTGSGSSLQAVDSSDFVQLQKLLSKVQELERVKISADGSVQAITPSPIQQLLSEATVAPNLVTAASVQTSNVQKLSGAPIDYPEKQRKFKRTEELRLQQDDLELDDLKLDLPVSQFTTPKPLSNTVSGSSAELTSSEELRDLVYAVPASPSKAPVEADKDFEKYQQFFSKLEDTERNAYKNMQPPMIQKTVTKEPPRFVATRKPQDVAKDRITDSKQEDLQELQKLLNNAQELKKLGVALPKQLSEQIEAKLAKTAELDAVNKLEVHSPPPVSLTRAENLDTPIPELEYDTTQNVIQDSTEHKLKSTTTSTTEIQSISDATEELEESKQKTAVFSLTTVKSLIPKEPKSTTESTLELPIFSATKIIEAAIKRAANKIGVSTENALGFRRRSDTDIDDMDTADGDMVGAYSDFNYQIAMPMPDLRPETEHVYEKRETQESERMAPSTEQNATELQRLISNLKELQKLNISLSADSVRQQADTEYLTSLKQQLTPDDDTIKSRRQSATPTSSPPPMIATDSTRAEPTRISLNFSLDNKASVSIASNAEATSTTTTDAAASSTEESRNGSLTDLEDSFGPDPNTETPLPPKKKNGFYFLADWNSFLEVGDGDDQVVVRLSPKIGDPSRFIPVKIP